MRYVDDTANRIEIAVSILNYTNISVYVSDLATNEVLFTNKAMQKMLRGKALAGRVCWEAIRNEYKRCEFCPIPFLLKNPGEGCLWEMQTENVHLLLYDCIIPWANGRLAHMQCIVEA